MPTDPLHAAKESLHERLKGDPNFAGIGLTKAHLDMVDDPVDAIYVMLRYDATKESVPRTWEGFPVKIAVVGIVQAQST